MITAAFISAMIGNELPGHGSIYLSQPLKFRAPVRPGDVVRVEVEVLDYDAGAARHAALDARVRRRHARRGRRGQGHRAAGLMKLPAMAALTGAAGFAQRARRRVIAHDAREFALIARLLVLAMFLNIASGAFVRLTGSGLGCPDWPLCKGRPVPPLDYHPVIEFSNRAIALAGILAALLDVALGAPGRRPHRAPPRGRRRRCSRSGRSRSAR